MKSTFSTVVLVVLLHVSWTIACNTPLIPTGSTWVSNPGCIQAETGTLLGAYCVPGTLTRCHCWGRCGYICDPNSPLCVPKTTLPCTTPDLVNFKQTANALHTCYRARHQAPALALTAVLNQAAAKCAVYYATKQAVDHTCPDLPVGAGENLLGVFASPTDQELAATATNLWYNEITFYNFVTRVSSSANRDFTQLVWKASTKVGFGFAAMNGFTVFVGLYTPKGNVANGFEANVLPQL